MFQITGCLAKLKTDCVDHWASDNTDEYKKL